MSQDIKTETGAVLLAEVDSPFYRLSLSLHDNDMECRATIVPKEEGGSISPPELLDALAKAGITFGIDSSKVENFCNEANKGKALQSILLAAGNPSKPGPDGRLGLCVHSALETAHYEMDKNGNIDYRHRHAFDIVKPGQMVGKIIPPRKGAPGKTVKDNPIPPVLGKPLNLFIGKGLHLDKDGKSIIAESAGRVVNEENTLYVTDELLIEGNVDMHVGTIDFAGFVSVKGDVLDGFDIKATKGIKIDGSIGACKIYCGGDVIIGSMYGNNVGRIKCIGNLYAHHICNLYVECNGNVTVSKEIRDSVVKTTGQIRVEDGNISGGECLAMKGIEAKNIGSTLCTPTTVQAGISYLDADMEQELQKRLEVINYQEEHISYTLGNALLKELDSLSDSVRRRCEVLIQLLKTIKKEQEILQKKLKACLLGRNLSIANPKINVQKKLYEGVSIQLGNTHERMKFNREGPCSIVEHKTDGSLLFLSLSPLELSAEEDLQHYSEMEKQKEKDEDEDLKKDRPEDFQTENHKKSKKS